MQTFLPYASFTESAKCLDNKRLGKQRVEAKQIYLALTEPEYGWKNHPAVTMWQGYEQALSLYGLTVCREWKRRGFEDSLEDWFYARAQHSRYISPWWIINLSARKRLTDSHQSNLLRKDRRHYSRFNWQVPDSLPYFWP